MAFDWPNDYTVEERIGIGTDTPSQALDVIGNINATGNISADNLTLNQNLTVSGNFQLGTLSVNEFSSDENLADNSNLALPTERAVKTYVDNNLDTKAALNGSAEEDFAANNLSVNDSLTVSNAISTNQLSVSGAVTGSLTIENNLTVGAINASGTIQANTLNLPTTGTQIFHNTNESGTPSGDGFRLRYDNNFFITNQDALVIEKTDGNNPNPDGGIAFVNTGNDGVVETALAIRGNGNVGIGTNSPTQKLDVRGSVNINEDLTVTGNILGRLAGLGVASASSLTHGQSIPVPDGFTRDECLFFATIKYLNFRADENILVIGNKLSLKARCQG